jgi:hypothetical protein
MTLSFRVAIHRPDARVRRRHPLDARAWDDRGIELAGRESETRLSLKESDRSPPVLDCGDRDTREALQYLIDDSSVGDRYSTSRSFSFDLKTERLGGGAHRKGLGGFGAVFHGLLDAGG